MGQDDHTALHHRHRRDADRCDLIVGLWWIHLQYRSRFRHLRRIDRSPSGVDWQSAIGLSSLVLALPGRGSVWRCTDQCLPDGRLSAGTSDTPLVFRCGMHEFAAWVCAQRDAGHLLVAESHDNHVIVGLPNTNECRIGRFVCVCLSSIGRQWICTDNGRDARRTGRRLGLIDPRCHADLTVAFDGDFIPPLPTCKTLISHHATFL